MMKEPSYERNCHDPLPPVRFPAAKAYELFAIGLR
jgi:hypothetical protein